MVKRYFKKIFGAFSAPKDVDSVTAPAETKPLQAPSDTPQNIDCSDARPPILFETCHGKDAFRRWKEIRAEGQIYPVIIGSQEEKDRFNERLEGHEPTGPLDFDYDSLDFPREFTRGKDVEAAEYNDDPDDVADFSSAINDVLERWTDEPFDDAQDSPTILRDHKGRFHDKIHIALIPADDWTLIPALLGFGGWNDCPGDEWHVAALRYWHVKYGAELVSLTGDIIEMRVKHRPEMLRDAVTLAMEQYYYCPDIVDQGVDDPANLAKFLMQNDMWYFWWD